MYDALMAVKPAELSLSQWAARARINRSIFNGIQRHGNPTMATLEKLLRAIDVDVAEFQARLNSGAATVRTEVRGTGMTPHDVQRAWAIPDAKPVPLLGTAYGGEWAEEGDVELTELRLAEILDYLGRPPSLAGDDQAYAVEIVGDSMAPRFEPRERVFVSPRAPVQIGDDVIVQLRAAIVGEDGQPHEASDVADQVTDVLIKRLVKRTAAFVELRQFNPDKTFQVPLPRVRRIHKVRGRL